MKITKKAINAALPTLSHFRGYAVQEGGYAPKYGTLDLVIARVLDDGTVRIRDYAVSEAKEADDYQRSGNCVEITEIIQSWIDNASMSRARAVEQIQQLFAEKE